VYPLKVPVAVNCCTAPAEIAGLTGFTVIEISPVIEPVPERLELCGLLPALSDTVSVPFRVPVAVGLKVTLIVHLPFAMSDPPQRLVAEKSPLVVTLKIVIAVVKLFVSVKATGALAVPRDVLVKFFELGARLVTCTPIPLKLTVCGLPLALSVMFSDPLNVPVVAGLKVTEIVHFAPTAMVAPHVLVWVKGEAVRMLEMVSVLVPVLVRVTFLTPLAVPMI